MSDIHSKPIAERIDWLFELAHRHGRTFRSPEAWLARERVLGVDRSRAELKSHFLSRFAAGVLHGEFAILAAKMTIHTAVQDWRSRSLELIGDLERAGHDGNHRS